MCKGCDRCSANSLKKNSWIATERRVRVFPPGGRTAGQPEEVFRISKLGVLGTRNRNPHWVCCWLLATSSLLPLRQQQTQRATAACGWCGRRTCLPLLLLSLLTAVGAAVQRGAEGDDVRREGTSALSLAARCCPFPPIPPSSTYSIS